MRTFLTFTCLSLSVTSSLAFPTARQISDPCAGLGGGAFDNATDFTVTAFNRTLPNANNTGAPLVLGRPGATIGAESGVFSTWASFPFNQPPILSLVDGGLIANSESDVKTVSTGASSGQAIGFTTSSDALATGQVFCAVANTDPAGGSTGFPAIALNGQTDLFSLCMSDSSPLSQNNVIYNASINNSGLYIFNTCYPITLQLVFSNK